MKSKLDNKEALETAITLTSNRCQVLKYFEMSVNQTNYNALDKFLKKHNVIALYSETTQVYSKRLRMSDDLVYCINSTFPRHRLKQRLIKEKLIPYECEGCKNNGTWNGQVLSLHLEHRNGINNDNRIVNLCFLCPNCHSQTDTYAGKNNNKNARPQRSDKRSPKS